jgi:hypothetical protein
LSANVSPFFVRRKKSLGVILAIPCFFLLAPLVSLTHAAQETRTITLAWDPNGESNLKGYKVYYRTSGGAYGKPIKAIENVSNPECPLIVSYGQKYYFVVTAYGPKKKESRHSNEISWPIQVLSPNGGEIIPSGSPYAIQWYADPKAAKFKLSYSTDNGITWFPINNGEFIIGRSFDWSPPP